MAFSDADEMFRLSSELQDVLQGRVGGTALTLNVGVAKVVPKLLAYRLLAPVLTIRVCSEWLNFLPCPAI
jgi:LysR family transcriptional activator of nhaA